jgi:hypothetical protein
MMDVFDFYAVFLIRAARLRQEAHSFRRCQLGKLMASVYDSNFAATGWRVRYAQGLLRCAG